MNPRNFYRSWFHISVCALIIAQITTVCLGEDFPNEKRFRRSPSVLGLGGSRVNPPSLPDFTKIQEQLSKLGSFSEGLEKALEVEKKARLGLQEFVNSVKDRIESLENAALPDEINFWEESNTCGGLIVSQTGKIAYKVDTSYEHHEKCVWTLRTNYRSLVKVQLTTHGLEAGYDYIAVTEVKKDQEPKSYRLNHKGKYVFDGPLLLVTFVTDGTGIGLGFSLEFEGVGQNVNKDVAYKHFHVKELSGNFGVDNLTVSAEDPSTGLDLPSLRSPTQEFTTIVVNPVFRNATQLALSVNEELLNLQPNACDKASLTFYDYLEENNTRTRCCGTECEGVSTLRNDYGFVLATFNKQLEQPQSPSDSTFQFNWTARDTNQRSDSTDTCGGTISGRVGRISYKMNKLYSKGERCVWVIKPTGRSEVKLVIRSHNFEDGYDFVTVSSFDQNLDIASTRISHGPTYNFSGPVIMVSFYSDDSNEEKGFELDWEECSSKLDQPSVVNDPVYFDQESGTLSLESLETPSYQFVVINPKYLDGSSIQLKLNSFESHGEQAEHANINSGRSGLYVYGNDDNNNFTLAQKYCDTTEGEEIIPEEFSAVGGVFILLVKINSPVETVTKLELTWRKGSPPLKPSYEGLTYVNITDECGGILIGDAGHIQYKLNSPYEDNARCSWIVQPNKLSKISFKLMKDGFESCCDYLIATPLNVENGTLGESLIINRESRVRTFTSPVIFITFMSDASLGNGGFLLEFTTSTRISPIAEEDIEFSHHMWKESPGYAVFNPVTEITAVDDNQLEGNPEADNSRNKKIIVTHVLNSNMDGVVNPITISAQINNFQVNENESCHRDSLNFFQVRSPAHGKATTELVECTSSSAHDDHNPSCSPCSEAQTTKTFKLEYNYFIAIFKPLTESNNKASFNFNWTLAVDQPAGNL